MSKPTATWRGGEALVEHLLGEGLVAHCRKLRLEGQHVQALDAERLQRPRLLLQRHEAKGLGVRLEPAAGVRLEGDHAQRRRQRGGGLGGAGDHLLVASVHAIEVAERQSPALGARV
jgi:hypothetical protein